MPKRSAEVDDATAEARSRFVGVEVDWDAYPEKTDDVQDDTDAGADYEVESDEQINNASPSWHEGQRVAKRRASTEDATPAATDAS